jgi:L-lactate utilization protein LutB
VVHLGSPTQYSAINLIPQAKVDTEKWNRLPPETIIVKTIKEIEKRGISVMRAQNADEALDRLKTLIPRGAEVMNGSSTTLNEIGYENLLQSGEMDWHDLHRIVNNEDNAERRNDLRRKSVIADYFLSGVNAIAQTGELVSCDRTGSRVGAWPYAAKHLILVSGINKIVPTLSDALQRVWEFALPLENARAHQVYGVGSRIGKCVILSNEEAEGRIFLILINDTLGY